ncbi:hypothetical protein P3W23_00315 [Luteibacter sp. PPL554]
MSGSLLEHKNAITLALMIGTILCLIVGYIGERVHAYRTRPISVRFGTMSQVRDVFSPPLIIGFNILFIILVLLSGWMIFKSVPDDLQDSVVWNIVGTISVSAICLAYVHSARSDKEYFRRSDFKAAALAVVLFGLAFIFYMWKRQAFLALLICDGILSIALFSVLISKGPFKKRMRHIWDVLCQTGLVGLFILIVWVGVLNFVL